MMIDIAIITKETKPAGKHFALAVCRSARLAQGGPPLGAGLAMAAIGHENANNMVAGNQIGDTLTNLFHYTGSFMPQNHGDLARTIAIDNRKVGMAQARSGEFDENFIGFGFAKLDFTNDKRFGLVVGAFDTMAVKNSGFEFHRSGSFKASGRLGRLPNLGDDCYCGNRISDMAAASG